MTSLHLDADGEPRPEARHVTPLAELEELRDLVRALRAGEVDGLVVDLGDGSEVLTLSGADRSYRLFVEGMAQGAATVSQDGIILSANPRLATILATSQEELVGGRIASLLVPGDEASLDRLLTPVPTAELRLTLRARHEQLVPVTVVANRLDLDNETVVCLIVSDETERVRAAQLLWDAQRISHIGHWRYDVVDDRLEWLSDEVFAMHGVSREDWRGTQAHYLELIDADDHESVRRALSSAIATGRSTVEYRVRLPAGELRHIRSSLELVHGTEGGVRVAGTCQDITEQVAAKAALQYRLKELTALASVSRIAHLIDDPQRLCELTAEALTSAMQAPHQLAVQVVIDDAELGTAPCNETLHVTNAWIVVDGVRRGMVRVRYLDEHLEILPSERTLVATIAETLALWLAKHAAKSALEQANVELHRMNEQLEEALGFKDDLLAIASHELRTPLTPILGFLAILSNHLDPLSEEQTRIVEVMRRNAQRMLSLVEDLLVAGRAMSGPLSTHLSDVTLADAVDRIVDELGPTIPTIACSVEGWHLRADVTHLHQALGNLLTNAVKYGAPPISITASSQEPGWVTVGVTDSGPGVREEFVPQMWDRFSQSDHGNTRVSRGVGLGLSIVRLLIEGDGGRVGYRAGNPTGAVFSFDLPGHLDPV